ncbi:MAG: accessory Sec system translocase SecA2 [Candidatus Aminicenantes bacterium]
MTKTTKFRRELKPYRQWLDPINRRRCQLRKTSDNHLKNISKDLKKPACGGTAPDELLVEAFALAGEVSQRVLQLDPFDVQVAAAVVMHQGKLAEMQTGEGKTLAAVLPLYLNALNGKGAHVLTFNDYLARRDAHWMGPIYEFLGLSVGFVQEGMTIPERQKAYAADITYLTAKEAGFDFLRDQRCLKKEDLVQRPFQFAIVDEADSILIDEARVPLVIAGEISSPPINPYHMAEMIRQLDRNIDYDTDEYAYDVNFTDHGIERMEKKLGIENLHDPENNQVLAAVNLALQAETLLRRDIDYIIREGKIELVDEFTGRIAENRRWPYGLQNAIEAKEGLEIQPEGTILGSITLQHFLGLYPRLAGMTATAKTSEEEFETFYGLKVVVIPPHRPCIRIDHEDAVFTHKAAKRQALLREIITEHAGGRPILVGTASVEESEQLAAELRQAGIDCQVLNAKNDEAEAAIVAEAGALKAVTISTNMAGRGTDIKLGGKNRESRDPVLATGGLYVIGTNRHESRRIDNQLRGRSARQGDPGSSRFFISLEDDLILRYGVKKLIPKSQLPQTQHSPIENPMVAREIARAQRIIEGKNFEIRKTLRNYSFLVEEQRKILQQRRKNILLDKEPLTLLASQAPERYNQLLRAVHEEILKQVEKQITLFYIDQCWTDHLEYISYIKEGIHLWEVAGKDPLVEFGKMIIKAFDDLLQGIHRSILAAFERVNITGSGIDPEREGLLGPTSTWTYLVNDSFFENPLRRTIIGSNAFGVGAALVILQYLPLLPFLIIGKFIRRLLKKKPHGLGD